MPETEESIRLNLEIQDNPNMKLPEGYKKVMETNVDYVHVLPKRVIPDSYRMAHELVDELIFDAFGFHVIEKKPLFSSFFKVLSQPKPRVDLKEIKTRYKVMDEDQKTRGRDNFRTNTKSIEGSLNKREYTTVSNDTKQKFINKAMEDKLRKEEEAKQRQLEQEMKRLQRQAELQEKMKDIKDKKMAMKMRKEEQERMKQLAKIDEERQRDEKRKKELEKKKQMVKEYRDKKNRDLVHEDEEEKEDKYKKYKAMRKDHDDFMKRHKENLQKQFAEEKKKREEEERKKKQR